MKEGHDNAGVDPHQSLPALALGRRELQWLLYVLPCLVAGLASLLTLAVDWRAALLLAALAGIWGVRSCPWTMRRRRLMPRLLLHRGGDQVELRLLNGERHAGLVLSGGVYAHRFLLLRFLSADGEQFTVLARFAAMDPRWRRWRLHARRHWSASHPNPAADADAVPGQTAPESPDRNGSRGIRGVVGRPE